jgi:hypothetical protein
MDIRKRSTKKGKRLYKLWSAIISTVLKVVCNCAVNLFPVFTVQKRISGIYQTCQEHGWRNRNKSA